MVSSFEEYSVEELDAYGWNFCMHLQWDHSNALYRFYVQRSAQMRYGDEAAQKLVFYECNALLDSFFNNHYLKHMCVDFERV